MAGICGAVVADPLDDDRADATFALLNQVLPHPFRETGEGA